MKELTIEQNKILLKKFPFLFPRNVWTDKELDDYDYSFILGIGEIPYGWNRLFLLFCSHLKEELDVFSYADKFRFTQIKEKYGTLRLYNNGYPKDSCVDKLINIYEYLSYYICEDCGKVAKYLTTGWIAPVCENCSKKYSNVNKLERKDFTLRTERHSAAGVERRRYDTKPYWNEYLTCRKMSDEEFFNYIIRR